MQAKKPCLGYLMPGIVWTDFAEMLEKSWDNRNRHSVFQRKTGVIYILKIRPGKNKTETWR